MSLPSTEAANRPKRQEVLLGSLLLAFLAFAGIGYFSAYSWQQQQLATQQAETVRLRAELQTAQKLITAAKTEAQKAKTPAPSAVQSTDEKVVAAAQAACEARVNPTTKKPLIFAVGKGDYLKYSSDKTFARLNLTCTYEPAPAEGASGVAYTLKVVNGVWVVVSSGQEEHPADVATYGIPTF